MDIFEKAKELGEMILASEESKALADATAAFEASEESKTKFEEFKAYRQNIHDSIQQKAMSEEEYMKASERLNEMQAEIKEDANIKAVIQSENEYNGFVDQIMRTIQVTVMGEEAADACGGHDHSHCGGCGGGHGHGHGHNHGGCGGH